MYIKPKSVHFDAVTITVVMLGKFVCTFFLWEGQGYFGGDKDQILSGGKRKGKREYGGEAQNQGYFCKIPIVKQDTNFLTTSNHHHCDLHAQKPTCRDFQVILSSSSWSKTTLCIC